MIWDELVDGTGQDFPHRVAFDIAGNLYACVWTDATDDPGVLLLKFAP